jgi:hypothetical protein
MDKYMAEKIDYLANYSGAYLYYHGIPVHYSRAVGECVHGFHRQIYRTHNIMA